MHIGCGGNPLYGWSNSDQYPVSLIILRLNATKTYPFGSDTFDYIFGEHMIEHITYSEGFSMLKEYHRVLKYNGKIRISTPDSYFLIDLYRVQKSNLQLEYINWATDRFIKNVHYYDDTFVLNNFVKEWGHLFIYDEKTLRSLLERVGFVKITRCNLNESEEASLRNCENVKRMPEGFLELESLILEATKSHDT